MSYIINPKTKRNIKVGSKVWRELLLNGVIENKSRNMSDDKKPSLKDKDAREKTQPDTKKYYTQNRKGTPTKIRKRLKQEELADYTAQCASRTLHKHMNILNEKLEDAYRDSDELNSDQLTEFENNLKQLILEEMVSGEIALEPTINTNKEKKEIIEEERELNSKIPPHSEYEVQENTEYEYY